MNDLDRILLHDADVVPSPGFSESVMEVIRAESELRTIPRKMMVALFALAAVVVGAPLVYLLGQSSLSAGDGLSSRMLWMMLLLTATTVAALLPLQLLED